MVFIVPINDVTLTVAIYIVSWIGVPFSSPVFIAIGIVLRVLIAIYICSMAIATTVTIMIAKGNCPRALMISRRFAIVPVGTIIVHGRGGVIGIAYADVLAVLALDRVLGAVAIVVIAALATCPFAVLWRGLRLRGRSLAPTAVPRLRGRNWPLAPATVIISTARVRATILAVSMISVAGRFGTVAPALVAVTVAWLSESHPWHDRERHASRHGGNPGRLDK
jgi:hypothetical protein